MALSRQARISLLLAIDVVFFWIELIVGYAVGSLALVADSFHMLNDVMSLVVALYAIRLTARGSDDARYSYGWHRAEILAALVNGVFLLALCFSISLEALERLFNPPHISAPKLIVIVGSLGLASNIVGLFLFHEHGHDHSASPHSSKTPSIADGARPNRGHASPNVDTLKKVSRSTRTRSESISSLYGHPAATRASLMQAAQDMAIATSPNTIRHDFGGRRSSDVEEVCEPDEIPSVPFIHSETTMSSERTPLLISQSEPTNGHAHAHTNARPSGSGSMNMQALLLHVFGDALGNVGVIATGLVIWLTEWKYKLYFDPVISIVIAAIIFSSALPLVRSTSFILLQAVPLNVSPESVREAILSVDGVRSLHELHIWQLSESRLIASVHVLASPDHEFMHIAKEVRRILHEHGVHSCTIQPEYDCPEELVDEYVERTSETSCLVRCPPNQECDPQEHACCPQLRATVA